MLQKPDENKIVFFAETNFRNQRKRFGIKRKDRTKHMYIVGKTGMGKTTMLENLAIQDIQSGEGIGIIDPHGEFAEKMLDFVPKSRIDDVIYFNPADTEFPIGFNPLEKVSKDLRHIVASGLLGVFKKIFGPEVFSARMEYFLANSIFAHLELPDSTLLGVNRIFGDKEYRKKIVSQIQDPIVKAFWENEFAKMPEQFMREAVAAIQNKVGQFSGNPLIRNIIGQIDSPLDLRKVMDEKKILIMNLSKGKIGEENSRLLGAMLVTKLYLTAMSRVDLPEEERSDFYLYVDEFQNFATDSFASILSEARKYRLNLVLAHQYMAQMEETVRDAVIGNVGTMIAFRVGGDDAEILEKEFGPEFTVSDLVNLGFAQIYLKLMIDGIASRPFSAFTLAPFPKPEVSYKEEIIKRSRARYGVSRADIEEKVKKWSGFWTDEAVIAHGPAEPAAEEIKKPFFERAEARPQRKLFEAKCAIDGKAVKVPFEPDPRRPVYCEEHLEAIRRGEIQPAGKEIRRQGEGRGEERVRIPIREENIRSKRRVDIERQEKQKQFKVESKPVVRAAKEEKLISLSELKSKFSPRKNSDNNSGSSEPGKENRPPRKGPNLEELREILRESLVGNKKSLSKDEKPPVDKGGVLKPGDSIKF